MNIYPICVPTYKRGLFHTLKYLKDCTLTVYVYCVKEDYEENYKNIQASNFIWVTDSPVGVCNVRNYIMQDQLKRGNEKIYMMDDDVFNWRKYMANPGGKSNKQMKATPEEFFQIWQDHLNDDTVFSGPDFAGFGGFASLQNKENLRIDGKQFMNLKVLNDNGIKFNENIYENLDMMLQIMEKRLPTPIRHCMIGVQVPQDDEAPSVIFTLQGHKWIEWAKATYRKWGDLIKVKKEDHAEECWGVYIVPVKKVLAWPRTFGDKFLITHNNHPELLQ